MTVSIVTPFKNSFPSFCKTYETVTRQSYSNFEWVIVDDKSSEAQKNCLRDLIKDPRIKVIYSSESKGAGEARNIALDHCNRRYLTFIDSDDEWHEDFLKEMLNIINSSSGFIFSGYKRFLVDKKTYIKDFMPDSTVTKNNILKGNPISCLACFIDTSKLETVPKFGSYKNRNDLVFFYRVLDQVNHAQPIKKILGQYNITKKSISSNKFSALINQWRVCRKIAKISFLRSIYCCTSWVIYGLKKYYFNQFL